MHRYNIIRDTERSIYPFITMLVGGLTFTLIPWMLFMLTLKAEVEDGSLFILFIGIPASTALLLFVFGHIEDRYDLLLLTGKSLLAFILALVGAFWLASVLGDSIDKIIPTEFEFLGNGLFMFFPTIFFGTLIGVFLYGKKAIPFFATVNGLMAIPSATLSSLFSNEIILILSTTLGISIGLTMGLYEHRNK